MKRHFYISTLLVTALVGLSLAGCGGDDLDTYQYEGGSDVSLTVWGPNPVMYGGTLTFKGSNLDQVTQISLPGCDAITSIEVISSGTPSEIRITVPTEAYGTDYVTLTTSSGATITTQTELSFEQGIEFHSFSPESVMPGDVLTITGEYLALVEAIEFADGVYVSKDDFVSQDRNEIQVVVPDDAQTGTVYLLDYDVTKYTEEELSDVTYNAVGSEDALEVGTPTVTALSSPRGEAEALGTVTAKAGETITITGTYFNLVASLTFGDADSDLGETELDEFTVSDDGTTLAFVLPDDAPDGDINLICLSGVEVPAGVLATVTPTDCVATPSPVKAGEALTITGSDMDLVASVKMPNVSDAISITVTETTVVISTVPTTAQEGNLALVMANGTEVEVAFTLVVPTVTAYDSNPVSAGGELTITGTDLDLVTGVQFGDDSDVAEVEVSSDGTSLTVTVPMNAESGAPTLYLGNGTSVEGLDLTVEEAVFCYATELPGDDEELEAGGTVTFTVANGDKLTGVEVNGSTAQYVLASGSQLIIGLPDTAGANTTVRLISSNGEITYTIQVTPSTEVNTVIWEGMVDLASWSINWQFGDGTYSDGESATAFADIGLAVGDVIHLYATAYADWWQIQFFNGHWEGQTSIGETFGNGNNVNSGIASLASGCLDITVTETMLYELTTYTDWGYCWILQGEGVIITKISVTHYNSSETAIWTGSWDCGSWSGNQDLAWGGYDWSTVSAGTVLTVYYTLDTNYDYWQMRFGNGSWSALPGTDDAISLEEGSTSYSITLTQGMIDEMVDNGGLVMTGCYYIMSKITLQ